MLVFRQRLKLSGWIFVCSRCLLRVSCNSGNPDIYNTAWAFKNCMTIREYIVAWDGGTIFDYNENRLKAGGIGSTQAIWEFYVERNIFGWPCRSRMGRRQIWT